MSPSSTIYAPPVVDPASVWYTEMQEAAISQPVVTTQPDSLLIFTFQGHGQALTSFSSTPALDWQGPIVMLANSGLQLYWALVPTPGTYTVAATLTYLDHFKIQGFALTGWGLGPAGTPFEATQGHTGPTATNLMACQVVTTQPNDFVLAYFEQEPEAVGSVLNTYTPISPFAWIINNQGLLYSEEEAFLGASFASPTNQRFDILQSSNSSQWAGSTIGIFAGPSSIPPPPPPPVRSNTITIVGVAAT